MEACGRRELRGCISHMRAGLLPSTACRTLLGFSGLYLPSTADIGQRTCTARRTESFLWARGWMLQTAKNTVAVAAHMRMA